MTHVNHVAPSADMTTLYIVTIQLPDGRWQATAHKSEEVARAEFNQHPGAGMKLWLWDEVKRQVYVPEAV